MTTYKATTYKTKFGYQARVVVYENGRYLWTAKSDINRQSLTCAIQDADAMIEELKISNAA